MNAIRIAALLLLALANWAPRLRGPLDLRWDAGVYQTLGMSLAEGRGYRLLSEPGEPRANQYPPLLPVLVAAGAATRPTWLLLHAAVAVLAYLVLRRWISPWLAFLAAAAGAVHVHSAFLSDLCFAEIPFAVASLCAVLAARRGWTAATGAAVWAAYLLRTMGLALAGAWVLEALLRRRFRQAAVRAVVAGLPVIGWMGYVRWVETTPEYREPHYAYQRAGYLFYNVSYARNVMLRDPFAPELGAASPSELAVRALRHLAVMPTHLGEAIASPQTYWRSQARVLSRRAGLPEPPEWLASAVLFAVGLCAVGGIAVLAIRRAWFEASYLAFTVALTAAAPWPEQDVRYLVPVTPLLAGAAALALSALPRIGPRAAMGVLLLLLLQSSASLAQGLLRQHDSVAIDGSRYRLFYYGDDWADVDRAIDWIGRNAAPGDVIAGSAPHRTWLRTRRKAVMPPFEANAERFHDLLDTVPVRFLVLDSLEHASFTRRYAAAAVAANPNGWGLRFASGSCRVYERLPSTAAQKPVASSGESTNKSRLVRNSTRFRLRDAYQ